jgi:adenosylcobinamide-GDP ribazoletransferase
MMESEEKTGIGGRVNGPFFSEIRLATGFLTILPVLPAGTADDDAVAKSFRWFPLIGFMIGAFLCFEDAMLALFLRGALRSAIVLMSLAAITGAVHLDGLADTADALGAGRNHARAHEILRDSRIGTFGALAVVFVTVVKILALAQLRGSPRYAALWLAPGLARWAMVAVPWQLEYLRPQGAGRILLDGKDPNGLPISCVVAIVGVALVFSAHALLACVVAVTLATALRAFYRRWLGGVTGDLIGAAGEIVELCVLVAMAAHGASLNRSAFI